MACHRCNGAGSNAIACLACGRNSTEHRHEVLKEGWEEARKTTEMLTKLSGLVKESDKIKHEAAAKFFLDGFEQYEA